VNRLAGRTILCDVDGVIRSWPPLDGIEAECGMPMGSIASTAFADDLLIPAITGAYDDSRWRRLITDRLSEEYPRQAVARAVELWSGTSGEVDTRVVEWLDEARSRDARVFLATNATSRLDDDLRVLGLLDRFDGVVNSSEIGAAKPDARFYRAAVTIAGTTPSGCLFIDDQPRNVDAATRLGMAGVHYQGFESLPNLP
jgi:putative hydrolase of the HAD superfamily